MNYMSVTKGDSTVFFSGEIFSQLKDLGPSPGPEDQDQVPDEPTKVVKIVHEVWSLGGPVSLLPSALGRESEIDGIERGGSNAGDGSKKKVWADIYGKAATSGSG